MGIIRIPTMSPIPTRAHLRVNTTSQAQTFTNNVATQVGNFAVSVDTHGGFSGGSTYTIPVTGLYAISASLRMSSSAMLSGSVLSLTLSCSGSQGFATVSTPTPAITGFLNGPSITATTQLAAGTTVVLVALQITGNNLTLDGSAGDNWWTITQID